jgi:hypothetical protein
LEPTAAIFGALKVMAITSSPLGSPSGQMRDWLTPRSEKSLVMKTRLAASCFVNLSSTLCDSTTDQNYKNLIPDFEDQESRLKLWGGNIGAFQDAQLQSSLDYRLRESKSTASQIRFLLSELVETLEEGK